MDSKQAEKEEKREKLLAFSERLKQLAGRKGMRQKNIADALEIEPSAVGQWFRANNMPGPSVEYRLADLLGVPHAWLINGTGERENEVNPTLAVGKAQPSYAQKSVEGAIRRYLEELIAAADGDPARLGWILEQMKAQLREPAHWRDHYGDALKSLLEKEHTKIETTVHSLSKQEGAGR